MTNKKKTIAIVSIVAFLLFINFVVGPYVYKREVINIVKAVLNHWADGNQAASYEYWQDPNKSPPISDLTDYKITKKIFDKEDSVGHALIYTVLELPSSTVLPSNKEWVFELIQTKLGWEIIDFRPSDLVDIEKSNE